MLTQYFTHGELNNPPATHSPSSNVAFCPPILSLILLKSYERSCPDLSDSRFRLDKETDLLGGDLAGEKLRPKRVRGMAGFSLPLGGEKVYMILCFLAAFVRYFIVLRNDILGQDM